MCDGVTERPVTPEQFYDVMHGLGLWLPDTPDAPPVALAVSGGSDSLAMAWLASHWRTRLLALVVDHGLREESAREAEIARQMLEGFGITTCVLQLTDLQAGAGIAKRARDARYEALIAACREAGCVDLLVAHQEDDQAETVVMRQRRGEGLGLAGMARIAELADIRLVRPLLGVSRMALRATLRRAGVSWCEDPSNANRKAERVRVRQDLTAQARTAAIGLSRKIAIRRMQQAGESAAWLAAVGCLPFPGWVALGETLPSCSTLAALIRTIGARPYAPSRASVEAAIAANRPVTLSGVRLLRARPLPGLEEQWLMVREEAAMETALPARDGVCWDRRFTLRAGGIPSDLFVAAAGWGLPRSLRKGWPAVACATLPALWRKGRRVCVPHLGLCEEESLKNVTFDLIPPVPVTETTRWD
ncbi:Ile-tRNA lysidine synthase [Acetobacter estunensis NRIC 0472]|uniref:tRNA(Ile)-lysidine synthase n=1 Tax=Acetobacter estunensis TaxID=104097 RepID=A0A967BA69_9PROT|nr:tRNA lysidine(34) synthetase TilS [Acetobacter estunensis]GBQ27850.1 Ile-tRNA lysidine synthase [Acetobacter estunensis NRIC 0472]